MRIITLLLTGLIITSCASSNESVKKDTTARTAKEKKALEHFMKGSIAENRGAIPEAILEYQDALKNDTSSGIYFSLAKAYYKLNKLSNALENIKNAIELEPKNSEYQQLLGNIYTSAHNLDSAVAVYQRIIKSDSTNTEALFNLGKIYKYDHPLKALKIFRKVLQLTGPEWTVLVEIAELNERLGKVDDTISTIEELLKINPSELKLQKILIESYIKANRLDDALDMVNQSLVTFPDDINLIEYKANILLAKADVKGAGKEYLKLVKSDKVPFDSKIKIASVFVNNPEDSVAFSVAKEMFEEIAKDSVDWQVNVYLGEIAAKEGNDSSAIEYFNKATNEANWNSRIWSRFAQLLYMNQKYSQLREKLTPVIKDFPDDFFLNLILGLAYSADGDNESAEKYLMKAVNLNPNDASALSALGFTLNQLKRDDDALVYLNRAKRINPKDLQVWSLLGLIYNGKKEFDKSDEAYEKALSIDSTNALVLNNYAYSLAERGIQLKRAEKMSKMALDVEPENSSYLDTYGWVLYRLGDYEEALKYINKALAQDSSNATLLDHIGDVYFKMNNKEKAIEYWTKALGKDESNDAIKKKIEEAKQ